MSDKSLAMMPWFPRDWLSATRALNVAERGAYHDLLCFQWEMGALPRDHDRLSRLLGISVAEFEEIWPNIAEKFVERDGKLVNHRLEEHRDKALEQRNKKRRAAEKTNAQRYGQRAQSGSDSGSHSDTDSDAHSGSPPSPSPSPTEEKTPPVPPQQRSGAKPNGKAKHERPDFSAVENLDLEAWEIWLAHRRATKKPAYKTTREATALARYPKDVQRAAVEQSMDKGWTGLFPEKIDAQGKRSGSSGNRFEQHRDRLREWLEHGDT